MPKKQATTTNTATAATATPARAVKTAPAKPRAPRVSSAKHSKSLPQEPTVAASIIPENRHETISKIAYGYWIARGYQGGSPYDDWIRAEQDYASRQ
jgi:hypothetical protein